MTSPTRFALLASTVALLPLQAAARETVTLWFWGASPEYREALETTLVQPFHDAQDAYDLVIEYKNDVDNDVRVAVMAGEGPDIVYTSGPSWVSPLAKAGKLADLGAYAEKFGWADRIVAPSMQACTQQGGLYCMTPSLVSDGMFYNAKVLAENGWSVPKTGAELEEIMKAAQEKGMYAAAVGNNGWQPINENYSSTFINQFVPPAELEKMLTGEASFDSPGMLAAMEELNRYYKAGYLGGDDYFSLNFDSSISALSEEKTPFFFAPSFAFQWAMSYFTGDKADDIGWAAFPQLSDAVAYPNYSIGAAFALSVNANSKVQEGAAEVLDMIMSRRFATDIAKVWPGYWSIPLKYFPTDPEATGVVKAYFDAASAVSGAVAEGHFGYKVQTFFPAQTTDVLVKDVEAMWLDKETPAEVVAATAKTFEREQKRGLVQQIPAQQ
ncbi:ABC transporter substrate-binding protein [Salipiger sp. H15]|uniref:ABC transporter substrate-binding protein n=1 Tax=Alloyangia sp. H15 TaxID=3029062 RepID=A0AAU8AQ45_9RHOB